MRKALSFLLASLVVTVVVPATAQVAPDQFKDMDPNHWAARALEDLRSKNILVGYPDGYFRGRRTLTRYEFAVALDRALKSVTGTAAAGEVGPAGPAGPPGPPGMTPEEVEALKKMANEFRDELTALGTNVNAINNRLDKLARDLADLKAQWDRAPKFSGTAWMGVRADRADGAYIDKDGRVLGVHVPGTTIGWTTNPVVVHVFQLGVDANIPGGATLAARLNVDNYKNFLGGNVAQVVGTAYPTPSDAYLDLLEVSAPLGAIGRNGRLTLGRFRENVSPLTLWKPDVDTYFDVPTVDDGLYRMDGGKLNVNFGSLGLEAFGAKLDSVQGTNMGPFNSPLAGMTPFAFAPVGKPFGQFAAGPIVVGTAVGVNAKLPIRQLGGGYIRLSALGLGNGAGVLTPGSNFSDVLVLGADTPIGIVDRLKFSGEWAKSITGKHRFETVNPYQNNAFTADLAYGSGGLNVAAGYKYIDPLFYTPGYWGRIGNWLNPTNIQGPNFRASYDFSPSLGLTLGGDFLSGARHSFYGFVPEDDINRVLVGVRWDIARNFQTTIDWEGVYYSINQAAHGIGTGRVHPTEHYITIGTGYNLTNNTLIKLAYQIGDYNGHGTITSAGFPRYNFNTITSQFSVKF